MFSTFFQDSPEYEQRKLTPFVPPQVTWPELSAAVPRRLFHRNTIKGLSYVVRDVVLAYILYKLAWQFSPFVASLNTQYDMPPTVTTLVNMALWSCYWFSQGIVLTSWWCLAHEASHGTLSSHRWINDSVGFLLHTFLFVPYFAWKSSHHSHHQATVSVERDENYVPPTRSEFNLPAQDLAHIGDYREALEESPIYTFIRIIAMQVLGLHAYLMFNCKGSSRYPPGTNHFHPSSPLFKPQERNGIVTSDIALSIMCSIVYFWTKRFGLGSFIRLYMIPFMFVNHWIVMLTYLQHTDPTVPYYRKKEWTFIRGAISTVDRPLLGWIGQVFFHNVSHNHVGALLESINSILCVFPLLNSALDPDPASDNQPEVTECIKKVLKDNYNYDSTVRIPLATTVIDNTQAFFQNIFRALYRSFVECEFIEDDGDIVFYKNRQGRAARHLAK
ncbi:hypothetical protein D9758_006253 [Tetrapyrgos nigripes]|uniref:Fatty acid desaturase domain-containing protein n=1 Tax=Tetrapyrgos nigripes TaxID=182062 RepID=A0A8H5LLB4_9AGAR|nr:hypothetical protein D9758_006253 [Tetrapyrgos nigripes]